MKYLYKLRAKHVIRNINISWIIVMLNMTKLVPNKLWLLPLKIGFGARITCDPFVNLNRNRYPITLSILLSYRLMFIM